jgi:hypothetical protein
MARFIDPEFDRQSDNQRHAGLDFNPNFPSSSIHV